MRNLLLAAALCAATVPAYSAPSAQSDGQRDFDWEIGSWTTSVRVLRNPLSGKPPEWAEYQGTSNVLALMGGRANFVELSVSGEAGKIEGGSLRLFNPKAQQWSLNYASLGNGMLTAPGYGSFDDSGRGTFYGSDMIDGRAIMVRFVITPRSRNQALFEQAYSANGGKNWEVNWIALDTRR
jgi:hypothetical protein